MMNPFSDNDPSTGEQPPRLRSTDPETYNPFEGTEEKPVYTDPEDPVPVKPEGPVSAKPVAPASVDWEGPVSADQENPVSGDQENPVPQAADEPSVRPDPSKPLPGESYSDYLRRLDREKSAAEEAADYGKQEYWNGLRDYGRGTAGDPNYGPIPEEYRMNGMSKAAFFCGLTSLFTIFFGFSWFFGALAILFALLSRGKKLGRQARIGLWTGIAGLGAFVIAFTLSIIMLVSSGLWDKMIEKMRRLDLSDPAAVETLQTEMLDEILKTYGVRYDRGAR